MSAITFMNFLNHRDNVISSDPSAERQLSQYVYYHGHFMAMHMHGYDGYSRDNPELPVLSVGTSHLFNNSMQY